MAAKTTFDPRVDGCWITQHICQQDTAYIGTFLDTQVAAGEDACLARAEHWSNHVCHNTPGMLSEGHNTETRAEYRPAGTSKSWNPATSGCWLTQTKHQTSDSEEEPVQEFLDSEVRSQDTCMESAEVWGIKCTHCKSVTAVWRPTGLSKVCGIRHVPTMTSYLICCPQIFDRTGAKPGLLLRLRQLEGFKVNSSSWKLSTFKAYSTPGCFEGSNIPFEPGSGFASSDENWAVGALVDDGSSVLAWRPKLNETVTDSYIGGRLPYHAATVQVTATQESH